VSSTELMMNALKDKIASRRSTLDDGDDDDGFDDEE
jgi:hypothetical protein